MYNLMQIKEQIYESQKDYTCNFNTMMTSQFYGTMDSTSDPEIKSNTWQLYKKHFNLKLIINSPSVNNLQLDILVILAIVVYDRRLYGPFKIYMILFIFTFGYIQSQCSILFLQY
jgi:hypothetical protein